MRHKGLVVLALISIVAVGNVLAEEIVTFTNGATMPIRSHEFDGDMIKVDLGDDQFMAFPRSVVEKIEVARGDVQLTPSSRTNQIIKTTQGTRVYGTMLPKDRRENWDLPGAKANSMVRRDDKGVFTIPAFPYTDHPGKAKVRVVANGRNIPPTESPTQGPVGLTPAGTKATVPGTTGKKNSRNMRQFGDR